MFPRPGNFRNRFYHQFLQHKRTVLIFTSVERHLLSSVPFIFSEKVQFRMMFTLIFFSILIHAFFTFFCFKGCICLRTFQLFHYPTLLAWVSSLGCSVAQVSDLLGSLPVLYCSPNSIRYSEFSDHLTFQLESVTSTDSQIEVIFLCDFNVYLRERFYSLNIDPLGKAAYTFPVF